MERREILVLDDLPEIGEFLGALTRRMRAFEIHVTTEVNSARALELVKQKDFDLIISDFRMKQVDGIEVLGAARTRNPGGIRVLMTGYNEIPTSMERIRQANVDAYLQKPFKSQDILLMILGLLSRDGQALANLRARAREIEAASDQRGPMRSHML